MKYILIAALIGFALCDKHLVKSFNNANDFIDVSHIITVGYEYDIDIYYGTGYESGPYTGADAVPADGFSYERYFGLFDAYAEGGYTVELFGIFEWTQRIYAEPWTFHPIEFWLIWYRPIASDWDFSSFDLNIYVCAFLNVLNFYNTWEEHTKVAEKSVVDLLLDISNYNPVPSSADDWQY